MSGNRDLSIAFSVMLAGLWRRDAAGAHAPGGTRAARARVGHVGGAAAARSARIYSKGHPDRARLYDVATYWWPWVLLTLLGAVPLLMLAMR